MKSLTHGATLTLLLLLNLLAGALALWSHSDAALAYRLAGKSWLYHRHAYDHSPLASLLLARPVSQWDEQGRLQLLSNHDAQFDTELLLADGSHSSHLRITIQGEWQISDGYLVLQSHHYSALPLDTIARGLLENQGDMLQQLWLGNFNRSRRLTLLTPEHLLLQEENRSLWLLTAEPDSS